MESVTVSAVALAVLVAGSAVLAARRRRRDFAAGIVASMARTIGADAYAEQVATDKAERDMIARGRR